MKHAVFCGTRNIYRDMETAAKALVSNSTVDAVHFLIEDAAFPWQLPDIVQCHDVSRQTWFGIDGPNANARWSWMVLMRAALCHVLPDADVVLSLDCDIAISGDVDPIWDTPIANSYFAGVIEHKKSVNGLQYANMGVCLYNLAKLRDGKADEIISVLNRRKYAFPEQDVFNYLCQGRIAELPKTYNDMWFNNPIHYPVITHYAARRRETWEDVPTVAQYRRMAWKEVLDHHADRVSEAACASS